MSNSLNLAKQNVFINNKKNNLLLPGPMQKWLLFECVRAKGRKIEMSPENQKMIFRALIRNVIFYNHANTKSL